MKRHWRTDELVEHWTLLPRETELLTNKTGATRLGFAVLLKFFQLEAYLPQQASAVPTVVEFIAKRSKSHRSNSNSIQWRGRTIEYHRAQIRKLHGFRETTVNDPTGIAQTTVASAHAFGRPPGIDAAHLQPRYALWDVPPGH